MTGKSSADEPVATSQKDLLSKDEIDALFEGLGGVSQQGNATQGDTNPYGGAPDRKSVV